MAAEDRNILDDVTRQLAADQRAQLFRATVTANDGSQVFIRRDDAAAADTQSYPKASGLVVAANDEVLVARVGNSYVVICKIIRN